MSNGRCQQSPVAPASPAPDVCGATLLVPFGTGQAVPRGESSSGGIELNGVMDNKLSPKTVA